MSAKSPLERSFDPARMRRYLGGCPSIVYPHLAAVSYIKDALESGRTFGAAALLMDAAEESIYLALTWIFVSAEITGSPERITLTEEHFRTSGLGRLELQEIGLEGGRARMTKSMIDEAWVSAFGKPNAPINFIGAGYLAGAFAAITGLGLKTFTAQETGSMALGDSASLFTVSRRK